MSLEKTKKITQAVSDICRLCHGKDEVIYMIIQRIKNSDDKDEVVVLLAHEISMLKTKLSHTTKGNVE